MTDYLCGCSQESKRHYTTIKTGDSLTNIRRDVDGMEICPEHGKRLVGWAAATTANPFAPPNAGKSKSNIDWTKFRYTNDRRDTRDPEELGKAILAKGNGHGN